MTPGETTTLDLAAVLARLNGDRELLLELADLYLEDEPALMGELETAVGRSDAEAVRRAAHAIKGSVANFAAARAQAAALAVEQAGRSGDLSSATALVDALRAELAAVREALTTLPSCASRGGDGL